MTHKMRALSAIILLSSVAPAYGQNASAYALEATATDFIGHYYLDGITEVGSEMVLQDDGRYQWFLTYGAIDQSSKGTWKRVADEIVLLPDPVDRSGSWFTLEEVGPWNEAFEQHVQHDEFHERNAAISRRCKFLESIDLTATPTISIDGGEVTAVELQAAAAADTEEVAARGRYEAAAVAAMDGDADSNDLHDAARTARNVWLGAQDRAKTARRIARLPSGERPEVRLPDGCQYEVRPKAAGEIDKAKWANGFGVFVHDPETGSHFNQIDIRFQFADGSEETRRIESNGRTWVPTKPDLKVVGIVATIDFGGEIHEQAFAFPPVNSGVASIILPTSKFVQPSFDELRLKIDGKSLIGFDGRGRYERAP